MMPLLLKGLQRGADSFWVIDITVLEELLLCGKIFGWDFFDAGVHYHFKLVIVFSG